MEEVTEFSFLSFLALPKCRHFKELPISLFTAFLLSFNKTHGHQILLWAPDRTLGKKFSLWTCVYGLLQMDSKRYVTKWKDSKKDFPKGYSPKGQACAYK